MKLRAFISFLLFAIASTFAFADPVVTATGQFDSFASATTLSAPDATWSLGFTVNSPASNATPQGFDVSFSNFSYDLNGSPVSDSPEHIRFFDASSGGMFTVFWGSETGYDSMGNPIPELSLAGDQLFSGPTSLLAGSYSATSWSYSDAVSYDSPNTPANVTVTPEPASGGLAFLALLLGGALLISRRRMRNTLPVLFLALLLSSVFSSRASAQGSIITGQYVPNMNQTITPLAPRGARFEELNPHLTAYPGYTAGQAVTTVVSPDHNTLLILTSGYNLWNYPSGPKAGNQDNSASNEYVFVFDISHKVPVQKQAIQVPNTYSGIVFDPSGTTFYVSGGDNDNVHLYDLGVSGWAERSSSPVALKHNPTGLGSAGGLGLQNPPEAAGLAITADGAKIVVANYSNDSISVLTKSGSIWSKTAEQDLRPGVSNPAQTGHPGGAYPYWVVIKSTSSAKTAYISSIRDREIDVVDITGSTPTVTARISVAGQPNKMLLSADQSKLYVAEDQTASVDVIDTNLNAIAETISLQMPGLLPANSAQHKVGFNTNGLALSPDQKTLYVTNGNLNDVAVVNVANSPAAVEGLIPTGWYPTSVSVGEDGRYLYVSNYKSFTGPNPAYGQGGNGIPANLNTAFNASNQYDLQMLKAGFESLPVPNPHELQELTQQVAHNDNLIYQPSSADSAKLKFLQSKIKHVIYIIKENRTYDQILGDLPRGNGDPSITQFGGAITPSFHEMAGNFADLDNFYDRSEVSYDGWSWSTSAFAPDVLEKAYTVNYANRGLTYDSEGTNRNVNVSIPSLLGRLEADPLTPQDPNLLPGQADVDAPDSESGAANSGYLWDGALAAGKTVRNYGFFLDLTRYNIPSGLPPQVEALAIPLIRMPATQNPPVQVAIPANAALAPLTDPYFRGFDNALPDYWRYAEWLREFNNNYASGGLPNLELVRFMHDHTGNFDTVLDGVNTVDLQQADNDYACGLLAQTIANSPVYKSNTLIFIIEDDSQAGGDHVDTHRSTAYIVGPYVRNAVVSTSYNTVNFIRTMGDLLGISPLNLNDEVAAPMLDAFDTTLDPTNWTFTAKASTMLSGTGLAQYIPQAAYAGLQQIKPTHDAKYWADATKGMNFNVEDNFDYGKYNQILWKGMMGDKPYPQPTGLDLRQNREKILGADSAASSSAQTASTSGR